MSLEEKIEEIEKIKNEILSCQKCELFKTRKNPVVGEGSLEPKVMFIGEAPGFNEDIEGRPFCGKAGEVLDELLGFIKLKREEVYITNIVKCRPPENRDPKEEEIKKCSVYLDRQIEIIKPKIIATLGRYSMAYIFKKFSLEEKIQSISKIHGKIFNAGDLFLKVTIIPLYHPAVATYNQNMIEVLKKDFLVLKSVISNLES